jgi:heat shock protein HslJ
VRYPYAFPSFDRNDAMVLMSAARRVASLLAAVPFSFGNNGEHGSERSSERRRDHRLTRMRSVGAVLAAAALCAACSLPKHTDAEAPPPDPFNPAATQLLDDTSWQLTSWTRADGATRDVPHGGGDKTAGAPLTLTLSTATGQRRASGFSGCNRFTGTYILRDGKLSFGPLAGTRMACASAGGKLESDYLDALAHIAKTGVQMRPPQELQVITATGDTLVFARSEK